LAQQPDASAVITRTLFVGLAINESMVIYCFVVSMILIFANPFWRQNHFRGRLEDVFDLVLAQMGPAREAWTTPALRDAESSLISLPA
jgi:hypothetical protein